MFDSDGDASAFSIRFLNITEDNKSRQIFAHSIARESENEKKVKENFSGIIQWFFLYNPFPLYSAFFSFNWIYFALR